MPAPEDKVAALRQLYESGQLDAMLRRGLPREKYDAALRKIGTLGKPEAEASDEMARASALGMPSERRVMPEAPAQPAFEVKPSAYVAGHGDAPTEDGGVWDDIKANVPQFLRDFTLLPSRSPVWFEPSDEEVHKALGASDNHARWMEVSELDAASQRYRDMKWNEAYEDARNRGESIYRARDINDASPAHMRQAKAYAETLEPVEAALRGADRLMTGGALFSDSDTAPTREAKYDKMGRQDMRAASDLAGVEAPAWAAEPVDDGIAAAEKETARNLDRAQDVISRHPVAGALGSIAGAVSPKGLAGGLGMAAGKVFGQEAAKGAISGTVRGGFAAGAGEFATEMAAQQFDNAGRRAAGREETSLGDQAWAATKQAGMAAGLGGLLNIPGSVSRGMRSTGARDASAYASLDEAGGGTDFWSMQGLKAPPGHEELAAKFPIEGSEAGARSIAAQRGAVDLETHASFASGEVQRGASDLADSMAADQWGLRDEVGGIADDFVSRGKELDRTADDQAMAFTAKFMDRANKRIQQGVEQRQLENEIALKAEGAPDYPAPFGPDNMLSDAAARLKRQDELDYGLETSYPSVSAERIIGKHYDIVRRLAFADDVNMPNTTVAKFRKSIDALFRKKVVSAEEADLYKDVAFDMRPFQEQMGEVIDGPKLMRDKMEVLIPRRLSARELDDFIKAMDEMGKFPNSPAPEAARFRMVGATAAELRDEAFTTLAGLKKSHNLEILEDERMFRSLGLARNTDEINAADVDQVSSVLNTVKAYAASGDRKVPDGLAVGKREFERWLMNHDEELFDDYLALRGINRSKAAVNDFNILAEAGPRTTAQSYQSIEDLITGKSARADDMLRELGALNPRVMAARGEAVRQKDLFSVLGVNVSAMAPDTVQQAKFRLHQIVVDGGDDFERLTRVVRPEQRQVLTDMRKAAVEVDDMFKSLGFAPDKGHPRWDRVTRERIVDGLTNIFDSYKKHGSKPEMNQAIDRIFASSPDTVEALRSLQGERAFQLLRRQMKEGVNAYGSPNNINWHISAMDFFKNHIDALMGYKQRGRIGGDKFQQKYAGTALDVASPFGAPVGYAMGATAPVDRDKVGEVDNIAPAAALRALIQAVDRLQERKR